MLNISWPELILITVVAVMLFGPDKLPDVARSLGKSVKAFKDGLKEGMEEKPVATEIEKEKPSA